MVSMNGFRGRALTPPRKVWSACLSMLLLMLLASTPESISAEDSQSPHGALILAPYKQELQAALRSGMARGAVEAIDVCRVQAPEIALSLSRDEISVGRSSHRLRNPDNVAPAWVAPVMAQYVADATDRKPRTIAIAEGRVGYVEPILLQPLCTTCHGETLSAEVSTQIEQLYPDDRATGFAVGDLRGVFWAEYPTL